MTEESFGSYVNGDERPSSAYQTVKQLAGSLYSDCTHEKLSVIPKSIALIDTLNKLEMQQKEVYQLEKELHRLQLDKETADITSPSNIDRRLLLVREMSADLQRVVDGREQLIGRLQQPYLGPHLKVHATHRRFICELLPRLAGLLTELSTQLDIIVFMSNLQPRQLESVLDELSGTLASLQTGVQSLCDVRKAFELRLQQSY